MNYPAIILGYCCTAYMVSAMTAGAAGPRISPIYPEEAQRHCIEGWVLLELTLDADGRVESARVLKAEPADIFNEAAIKTAAHWKFDESSTVRTIEETLRFELRDCVPEG